jgi:hypothetical protein
VRTYATSCSDAGGSIRLGLLAIALLFVTACATTVEALRMVPVHPKSSATITQDTDECAAEANKWAAIELKRLTPGTPEATASMAGSVAALGLLGIAGNFIEGHQTRTDDADKRRPNGSGMPRCSRVCAHAGTAMPRSPRRSINDDEVDRVVRSIGYALTVPYLQKCVRERLKDIVLMPCTRTRTSAALERE